MKLHQARRNTKLPSSTVASSEGFRAVSLGNDLMSEGFKDITLTFNKFLKDPEAALNKLKYPNGQTLRLV